MSFCEHCEGQRFDRSRVLRVLRVLRAARRATRKGSRADDALAGAPNAALPGHPSPGGALDETPVEELL